MRRWLAGLVILLAGCASAPRPVPAPLPPLDTALAAACVLPAPPAALADYDATDDWLQHLVLPAFADCARRHAALVRAWGQARGAR